MELPNILALALQLLLLTTPIYAQSSSSTSSATLASTASSSRSSSSASTTLSQTTTKSAPSSTSTAVVYPGNTKWAYYGCQNETTGYESTNFARALAGMEQTKSDDMTVEGCFNICNARGTSFAGLEYASECFCSNHLNALSAKLADSECNTPCSGNSSQACGGALRLSVYSVKTQQQIDADNKKGAGIKAVPQASSLALGVAMGMMLWLA